MEILLANGTIIEWRGEGRFVDTKPTGAIALVHWDDASGHAHQTITIAHGAWLAYRLVR